MHELAYFLSSYQRFQWLKDLVYYHVNTVVTEARNMECKIRRSRRTEFLLTSRASGVLAAKLMKYSVCPSVYMHGDASTPKQCRQKSVTFTAKIPLLVRSRCTNRKTAHILWKNMDKPSTVLTLLLDGQHGEFQWQNLGILPRSLDSYTNNSASSSMALHA